MEAEKHVMRAQLRDLMEKHQAEVQQMTEQHQAQMDQAQQDLLGQLEEMRRASVAAHPANQQASESRSMSTDLASIQRISELEGWLFSFCNTLCIYYPVLLFWQYRREFMLSEAGLQIVSKTVKKSVYIFICQTVWQSVLEK